MFSDEDILKISELSKVGIDNNEIELYKKELSMIMNEINKIKDLDLECDKLISPTSNMDRYQTDEINNTESDKILNNAPDTFGNFIKVIIND